MAVPTGRTISSMVKSLLRDPKYLAIAAVFPALLSYVTDLFRDGFLAWPVTVFLSAYDASAISTWMGGARRSDLAVSASQFSVAVSVIALTFPLWMVRLTMMRLLAYLAAEIDLSLVATTLNSMFIDGAAGVLLTSLFSLLIVAQGDRGPWLIATCTMFAPVLFGTSIWISGVLADLHWQDAMSSLSDPVVALVVALILGCLSVLTNLLGAWMLRAKTLREAVESET